MFIKLLSQQLCLSGKYHSDNVFVNDKYSLSSFLQRVLWVIFQNNEEGDRIKILLMVMSIAVTGEITIEKFLNYLYYLPSAQCVKH